MMQMMNEMALVLPAIWVSCSTPTSPVPDIQTDVENSVIPPETNIKIHKNIVIIELLN